MKSFLRIAALLGLTGACYWFGRWQALQSATEMNGTSIGPRYSVKAAKTAASGYYTNLGEIRALFADQTRNWQDKWSYFKVALMPGINPANLPAIIQYIGALSIKPNESNAREEILQYLFEALVTADPVSALSLIDDFPHLPYGDRFITASLKQIAASDPQKALDLLGKLPPEEINPSRAMRAIFGGWASEHPAEAAEAAMSLLPATRKRAALDSVAAAWAKSDPQSAIRWAQSLPPENLGMVDYVVETAVPQQVDNGKFDGPTLAAELNLVSNISVRNSLIYQNIPHLPPVQAMDWLNQYASGQAYDDAVNQIFGRPQDWDSLTAALDKITDPGVRASAIVAMPNDQQQDNPKAALAWAQTLPATDATARDIAINGILSHLAATDPATAAAFVQSAADPSAYMKASPDIARALSASDPQAALDWTKSLPDGAGKDNATGTVLAGFPPAELPAAWNYATSLPEGASRNNVMVTFATGIANSDPAQAATFALQIPDGPSADKAVGAIAETWVEQAPQAFTVWLTGLPAGEARDMAVAKLVDSPQTVKNPADVLAWANTVTDPEVRAKQLNTVLTTWMARDSTAALNAARTVNLPEAARADLVQKLTQAQATVK